MNVLHLTYSLSAGGRRNAIVNLCEGLVNKSVNSYTCSITHLSEEDFIRLSSLSFKGVFSMEFNGRYFSNKSLLLSKLSKICEKNNIDLIHTHDATSQIITAWMHNKNKTIPHVHTFHRSLDIDTVGIKNKIRNYYANQHTNIITVGSNDRKNHLKKYNLFLKSNKIQLIPFGIEVYKYAYSDKYNKQLRDKFDIDSNDIIIGCIGHFGKEKGLDIALKSFATIHKEADIDNLKLIILGKGNTKQTKYLLELCNELSIKNNVLFPGFDEHIEKWYSCFDIFLHTPRKEAFGLVVIEAMAASLPVVASRVGGIVDIVSHNTSGYLVESCNPNNIAEYLLKLIKNKQDIKKFGDRGYELAKTKFSLCNFANGYYKLYKSLTY